MDAEHKASLQTPESTSFTFGLFQSVYDQQRTDQGSEKEQSLDFEALQNNGSANKESDAPIRVETDGQSTDSDPNHIQSDNVSTKQVSGVGGRVSIVSPAAEPEFLRPVSGAALGNEPKESASPSLSKPITARIDRPVEPGFPVQNDRNGFNLTEATPVFWGYQTPEVTIGHGAETGESPVKWAVTPDMERAAAKAAHSPIGGAGRSANKYSSVPLQEAQKERSEKIIQSGQNGSNIPAYMRDVLRTSGETSNTALDAKKTPASHSVLQLPEDQKTLQPASDLPLPSSDKNALVAHAEEPKPFAENSLDQHRSGHLSDVATRLQKSPSGSAKHQALLQFDRANVAKFVAIPDTKGAGPRPTKDVTLAKPTDAEIPQTSRADSDMPSNVIGQGNNSPETISAHNTPIKSFAAQRPDAQLIIKGEVLAAHEEKLNSASWPQEQTTLFRNAIPTADTRQIYSERADDVQMEPDGKKPVRAQVMSRVLHHTGTETITTLKVDALPKQVQATNPGEPPRRQQDTGVGLVASGEGNIPHQEVSRGAGQRATGDLSEARMLGVEVAAVVQSVPNSRRIEAGRDERWTNIPVTILSTDTVNKAEKMNSSQADRQSVLPTQLSKAHVSAPELSARPQVQQMYSSQPQTPVTIASDPQLFQTDSVVVQVPQAPEKPVPARGQGIPESIDRPEKDTQAAIDRTTFVPKNIEKTDTGQIVRHAGVMMSASEVPLRPHRHAEMEPNSWDTANRAPMPQQPQIDAAGPSYVTRYNGTTFQSDFTQSKPIDSTNTMREVQEHLVTPPNSPQWVHPVSQTAPTLAPHAADVRNIVQQLSVQIEQATNQDIEISLSPQELGSVRMRISLIDGGITLALNAERAETYDLMRRHIDLVEREFRELGYENIAFDFQHFREERGQHDNRQQQLTEAEELLESQTQLTISQVRQSAGTSGLDIRI